jgi:hypothetical protein
LPRAPGAVPEVIRARGKLHLQGVNGWHSRFQTWLRRVNGVASRYLADYTGWLRVPDAPRLQHRHNGLVLP